jgi:transglutaminase-like putative cysteine protease
MALRRFAWVGTLILLFAAGSSPTQEAAIFPDRLRQSEPCTRLVLSEEELLGALRDQHFTISVNGQRAGHLDTRLEQRPDGSFAAHSVENTLLYIRGERDDGATEQTWFFSPSPPHPLLRAESTYAPNIGSQRQRRLEQVAGRWQLTTNYGRFHHVKEVAAIDFTLADFVAADVWLARPHQAGDTLVTRTLLLNQGKVLPARYRVLSVAHDSCSYEESDFDDSRTLGRWQGRDHHGFTMGCLHFEQGPAPTPWSSIIGAPIQGEVKVGHRLSRVETISRLRLAATGEWAVALVSGPGQTVTPSGDGKVGITLDLAAPVVRATPEEITEALEDTVDFPHHSPEVHALLGGILQGRQLSRRALAEELIQFVQVGLTYDTKAEPESMIALIHGRRGVCRHFADLVTTLLRAANVPARSVCGLACGGGEDFAPHRWTELVCEDGAWLAIDPTFGQMRTTAHVRLPQSEEGRLVMLALQGLHLEVVEVSRDLWVGWRYLPWLCGGVALLVSIQVAWRARRQPVAPPISQTSVAAFASHPRPRLETISRHTAASPYASRGSSITGRR